MKCLMVTGTSTGVGKTVTTAALAWSAHACGLEVAVVKPVQTGIALDLPTDSATIRLLSRCRRVIELVALDEPLAPDTAARRAGITLPSAAELAARTAEAARGADLLLVEGAGGVLVRLDTAGGTLLDVAAGLSAAGAEVSFVVVTGLALGTLNHTELTVRAIHMAGYQVAGLVVGSLPEARGLAEESNLSELTRVTGCRLVGAIPEGVGQWPAERFGAGCARWLDTATLLVD